MLYKEFNFEEEEEEEDTTQQLQKPFKLKIL